MAPPRRPRFTINDDEDDDSERDDPSPSSPSVPAIVVDPSPPPAAPALGRPDFDAEERHVGFARKEEVAPTPVLDGGESVAGGGEREDRGEKNGEEKDERGRGFDAENLREEVPPSPENVKKAKGQAGDGKEDNGENEDEKAKDTGWKSHLPPLPGFMEWIPPHMNWKGWRPVIRSSVAAWCGLILMLCGPSERMLGQASFLVLIVATICPAALPIASQLEQTFFQFLLVSASWAYGCLALAIAHAARTQFKWTQAQFATQAAARFEAPGVSAAEVQSQVQLSIFHGDYLEPASSVVCAIFLGAGCGFLLWLRGFLGPGPALFGVIFAIILQVIMLTTGVMFPYAYYSIGLIFYIPFCCQQAINLACTFLIFPETLAHQFSDRLIATLTPLQKVIADQKPLLETNPRTSDWLRFKTLRAGTNAAIGGVALLGLAESNLTREVSFARVNGKDLQKVLQATRILTARTTGFPHFYELLEKHLHRDKSDAKGGPVADDLVIHIGRSRPPSPDHTPGSSRRASPTRERRESDASSAADAEALNKALSRVQHSDHHHSGGHHSPSGSVSFAPSPLSPSPRPASLTQQHSQSHLRRNGVSSTSLTDLPEHPDRPSLSHDASHEPTRAQSHPHHSSHHSSHGARHSHGRRSRSRTRHGKHTSSSHVSLPSLLHDVLHPHLDVRPVGVLESAKYGDLEDYLHNEQDEAHLEQIIALLSSSSSGLIGELDSAVGHLIETIHRFKSFENTWGAIFRYDPKLVDKRIDESRKRLEKLKAAYELYRDVQRLDVVRPFGRLFDPFGHGPEGEAEDELKTPSHRGLFWAFAYQHSLIVWSEALIDLFETMVKIEEKRRRPRFWFPDWKQARFAHTGAENDYGEEDPDALRELNTQVFSAPRHPDYAPPQTLIQVWGIKLFHLTEIATRRDVLFGLKAAVLVGLCSMPAYFKSTSFFFYRERGIWVIIMICLTTNQFLGDVFFGFLVRVFGTLAGAAIGLLMWSIAAQTGTGNPFAVAAVCAVFYPFIFYWRVHYLPPMTAILPAVTAQLVIGYSWQDAHNPSLATVGYGWSVAWRRFVCVMIGISIAFVWAFVPPATSQKVTIRRTYAKVIYRLGDVVAQLLSFANTKDGPVKAPKVIVNNIVGLRQRVNRTVQARAMARFELSIQGKWPSDNYASLQTLQMELLDQLGQLASVISKLDRPWTKALLHRTQLSNPRFLQDVFGTLQLISAALDHGAPLPFIYNPLLERFLRPPEVLAAGHTYGFDVQLGDADEEYDGLPQHVDLKTICSLDYLRFSSGVSQAYAIVNRIDRLMFVAKSLVGENYLIYGFDASGHGAARYQRVPDSDVNEHFHDPDSRRTSFDRSNSMV
ncbi:hypothetical protein JCM10207_006768 [Rhodosporidiobolus poonsookiae]